MSEAHQVLYQDLTRIRYKEAEVIHPSIQVRSDPGLHSAVRGAILLRPEAVTAAVLIHPVHPVLIVVEDHPRSAAVLQFQGEAVHSPQVRPQAEVHLRQAIAEDN